MDSVIGVFVASVCRIMKLFPISVSWRASTSILSLRFDSALALFKSNSTLLRLSAGSDRLFRRSQASQSFSNASRRTAKSRFKNFSRAACNNSSEVTSWSSKQITIRAPYDGSTGNIVVRQDGKTSNGVPFTLYPFPTITNVSTSSGAPGTIVTITGTNLLDGGGNARVTFNGTPAAIVSDTATSIQVAVPAGATSGRIIMEVNNVALYALQHFTVNSVDRETEMMDE
jgi:hypothetical protein